MITPFLQWRYDGRAAGNGWNSPVNNAEWGTDYLNRTGTAKSNMYDNRPEETKYIYTDDDNQGNQLIGANTYAINFVEVPPVKGFWSLTLYDAEHFFHPNPLNRYSLGTKNKTLRYQRVAQIEEDHPKGFRHSTSRAQRDHATQAKARRLRPQEDRRCSG
jgi:hypothetical protein